MNKISQQRHIIKLLRTNQSINVKNSLQTTTSKSSEEPLSTYNGSKVLKWYSCGPTVYDDAHLGHARAYVTFDIIRRILETRTDIKHIEYALGVTDIDDKIVNRSKLLGIPVKELAKKYEKRFFEDMECLGVLPPTKVLRVTEHINQVKDFINDLQTKGCAYESINHNGNIYFSVQSRHSRYAQLERSRSQESGDGGGYGEEKVDGRDFALWKREDDDVNCCWDSRWGLGRPGWHVECSVMSIHALGNELDIHTGGIDLKFPHHTNELATAEAHLQINDPDDKKRWVNTWLHAGHLHITGHKMSKSLKNFISIKDFIKDDGCCDSFRIFCLMYKYSSPVEYTEQRMIQAKSLLKQIRSFLNTNAFVLTLSNDHDIKFLDDGVGGCDVANDIERCINDMEIEVDDCIANDFDTPRLIRSILKCIAISNKIFVKNTNKIISGQASLQYELAKQSISTTLSQLGLSTSASPSTSNKEAILLEILIKLRGDVRKAARNKNTNDIYKSCDEVRQVLNDRLGIEIKDQ